MSRTRPQQLLLVIGSLAVALIPHTFRLPVWITVWCLACWVWAILCATGKFPWPGALLRHGLAVTGFMGALASSGFRFDRDVGTAILAVMVGLKPLETRTYRDSIMAIFLTYFLIITNLLYSNALVMLLYMLLAVLLTTSVLVHINHPDGDFPAHTKLAGRMLMYALPLAAILFVLFPRIQGSLWRLPSDTVGVTGFSDHLSPGSVSQLTRNNDVAFRVQFPGVPPPPDHLYWRGLVFWEFDGLAWRQTRQTPVFQPTVNGQQSIDYTITLEPHQQRWLFALDLPATVPPRAMAFDDHTLQWEEEVIQPIQYRVASFPEFNTGPLPPGIEMFLLPEELGNPKARQLARRWASSATGAADVVSAAMAYFQNNDFTYTLNPPLLGEDPIDDFLFETRRGYCEHFASTMAFLMRSVGIPARVVGGYQGGERNPFGDYWIVRQSDAHAWTEIWSPNTGWKRIDPTTVVAPERITSGVAAALPPNERTEALPAGFTGPFASVFRNFSLGWDAANALWRRQVIGYTALRQKRLFSRFGVNTGSMAGVIRLLAVGLILTGVATILYVWGTRRRRRTSPDPIQEGYHKFCSKLARCEIPRHPEQGPLDYLRSIRNQRLDLSERAESIIQLYVRLRYSDRSSDEEIRSFQRLVREFRPAPRPS